MFLRTILFSTLILICSGAAFAQRPGPQFWRKMTCEPFEPRTQLEAFEQRHNTVIIKGFTRITTIELRGMRIDAVEMRQPGTTFLAKGIVIVVREGGEQPNENRAFVDYGELEPLLNAIDMMSRVDENATKLPSFEARYVTAGDLEISVFRQTRSGTAVTITTGICDQATISGTLDDLAKVKAMIQEAKTRLDDIR